VFESFSDHAQRQSLNLRRRFGNGLPISQDSGKLQNFGNPTTITFFFAFKGQFHCVRPFSHKPRLIRM